MNVKRFLAVGILGLFLFSMVGFVLGDAIPVTAEDAGRGVNAFFSSLFTGFGDFLKGIAGTDVTTIELMSKFFFAILLGMIIYTVISSFFSDSSSLIQWGITIAVTSIAFIGMPAGYLEALKASYGAMGLTILTVIPFIIMVLFTVKVKDYFVARGIWAFYVFYYLFIIGNEIWKDGASSPAYWVAILGGIVMFITIPWIRSWFAGTKLDSYIESGEIALKKNKAIHGLAKKSREDEVAVATS